MSRAFGVGQVLYGGEANQYFTLLDFADRGDQKAALGHPTALEWVLGPVGLTRIADEANSPVTAIKRVILRYEGDL